MTKERTGTVSPSTGQRRGPATKVRAERLAFLGLFLLPGPQLFPGTMKLPKTQLCSIRTFSVSGLLPLRDLRSRVPLPPQLPSPRAQSPQPHKITWGSSGFSASWQLPLPSPQQRGQRRRETHLFKLPSALQAPGWRSSPLSRCLESSAGLVCCEQFHSQKQSVTWNASLK